MQAKSQIGTMLWNFLALPLDDPEHYELIHLSHADLDGYGCTVVTALFKSIRDANVTADVTANYHYYNTHKVGEDKIYDVLDNIFSERLSFGTHRRLHVLITDLGGINVKNLFDRYAHVNHGDIDFLVIDHHRSIYDDDAAINDLFTYTNELKLPRVGVSEIADLRVLGHSAGRVVNITYTTSTVMCSMLIGHDVSATKIYGGLLIAALFGHSLHAEHEDLIKNIMRFCDLVSRYDTGDFGEWYIPESAVTLEMIKSPIANALKNIVSDQNILNMRCKIADEHRNELGNPPMQFVNSTVDMIRGSNGSFTTYDREVIKRFMSMSNTYDDFVKNVVTCDTNTVHANVLPDPVYRACHRYGAVYVHAVDDTTKNVNLNLYVKRFFETTDPNVVFIWYWQMDPNTGKRRYELRSPSDGNANCYEIAKALGGGGHPHAAGFML